MLPDSVQQLLVGHRQPVRVMLRFHELVIQIIIIQLAVAFSETYTISELGTYAHSLGHTFHGVVIPVERLASKMWPHKQSI